MTDTIPENVTMKPVASSQISAIGYDATTNQLYVDFGKPPKHSVYRYDNVDANLHAALMGEGVENHSVGRYFIRNIKNAPEKYPYAKLDLAQPEAEAQ